MPATDTGYAINATVESIALNTGQTRYGKDYHDVTLYDEENNTRESYRFFGEEKELEKLEIGVKWQCTVQENLSNGTIYYNLNKIIQRVQKADGSDEDKVSTPSKPKPDEEKDSTKRPPRIIDIRERATNARTALMQAVAFAGNIRDEEKAKAITSSDIVEVTRLFAQALNDFTESIYDVEYS